MNRKPLLVIFALALALGLMANAPGVRADDLNQATQLTFNQPIQIPGNIVLPAGTYWFTVFDNPGFAPNVVQIFNADRSELYATLMAIPTIRMNRTDQSELQFVKQSQREPAALVSWFYPDRRTGHEFLYAPREEARLSEGEQITVMVQNAGPFYNG